MNATGPDVSFYQDDPETPRQIDFAKMATQASFVNIRAGQNLWEDQDFDFNWCESKAVGLPRGSYWFYDSRIEPKLQARKYVTCFADIKDLGELPLWPDFEDKYNGPYGTWQNWYTFLEELKRLVPGKEIGIYTAYYYWFERTIMKNIPAASLEYFHQYPLWIANYDVDVPQVPKPWKPDEWLFWQFTDHEDGALFGVESHEIDMNYFNGDEAAFRTRFNLDVKPEPPQGGDMYKYEDTLAKDDMSLREGHSTSAIKISGNWDMPLIVYGDEIWISPDTVARVRTKGDIWIKVKKLGAALVEDLYPTKPANQEYWMAVKHLGADYGILKVNDIPVPPTDTVVDVAVRVNGGAVGVVTVNDAEYVKK